jgi:hypothetical protein
MQSTLIRQPGTPQTIIELAELLGCWILETGKQ